MSNNMQMERANKKLKLFKKQLQNGKSKAAALVELKKKFGSGMDPRTCTKVAKELGLSGSEMKSRGQRFRLTVESKPVASANTVKAPAKKKVKVQVKESVKLVPTRLGHSLRSLVEVYFLHGLRLTYSITPVEAQ